MTDRKLSCRRDAAPCFALLKISLSHSKSLKMVVFESLDTVSYLPSNSVATVAVSLVTTTTITTTTTTNVMDYSAAITQLRGHFTKSRFKTVAPLSADVC